jgi:hypothetical protein
MAGNSAGLPYILHMEKTLITLPTISWQMLTEVLGTPRWATTLKQYFIAGRMDEEGRIAIPKYPTQPVTPDIDLAWKQASFAFEFSAKEIEVIKVCIKFYIGQGAFPANQYAMALLLAFEVEPSSD